MSSFYTNFFLRGSKLYVRRIDNGITSNETIELKPSLYLKGHKNTDSAAIDGSPLGKVSFDSVRDAKDFAKSYENAVYGYNRFDYAHIHAMFPGELEYDIKSVKTVYIDIETTVTNGFPNVGTGNEEVLLITMIFSTGEVYTLTAKDAKAESETKMVVCADEKELLKAFIALMQKHDPHIITGWNVKYFDMAYMIARIDRILGSSSVKRLSPFGMVSVDETNIGGRLQYEPTIHGITILDYLDLYKKFELSPRESYKLDNIAWVELNARKLEYDGSFEDFYLNEWDKFVEYNIIDTKLVKQLDDKLKFIDIAINMAYSAKCNFDDVFRVTRIWDNIIYCHLFDKNIQVEYNPSHHGDGYEGALVKDTIPGKYEWLASFDIESLYPSLIIQYNISPDTMVDPSEYIKITPYDFNNNTDLYKAAKAKADELDASLCANGSMFYNKTQGFIPLLTDKFFQKRKAAKAEMKVWKLKAQEIKDTDPGNESELNRCNDMVVLFDKIQHSTKILINSLYGCLGTPYFRMYNVWHAEGITLSGQTILDSAYKSVNGYLNKILCNKINYIVAGDTDSGYFDLSDVVYRYVKPGQDPVEFLDRFCDRVLSKELNAGFDILCDRSNAFCNRMNMKREAIGKAVFVAKKNYVMMVYDNEGVRYSVPELKITGLEAIKSSTPEFFRNALRESYLLAFNGTCTEFQAFASNIYTEYMKITPEEMSSATSVSNVDIYAVGESEYTKGAPQNSKAAIAYNRFIEKNNLTHIHKKIGNGDKIRILKLKEPNPFGLKCMAYIDKIPEELGLDRWIDREGFYDKFYVKPVMRVFSLLNWPIEETSSVDELF